MKIPAVRSPFAIRVAAVLSSLGLALIAAPPVAAAPAATSHTATPATPAAHPGAPALKHRHQVQLGAASAPQGGPAAPRGSAGSGSPSVNPPATAGGSWTSLGPSNFTTGAGRVLALTPTGSTVDSGHPLYLGSAGGGVWKSTTGSTWTPLSDTQASLAVSAIATDGTNGHVFAGTGESNAAIDSQFGQGILVSADGGGSWALKNTGGIFTNKDVSSIVFDPTTLGAGGAVTSTTHVYAGLVFKYYSGAGQGIAESTDGGSTWSMLTSFFGHDVFNMFAASDGTLYATIGGRGDTTNGLYSSTNGGANWNLLLSPSWGASSTWRWVATVDPATAGLAASSRHIYAAAGDLSTGAIARVFSSNDGGTTWADWSQGVCDTSIPIPPVSICDIDQQAGVGQAWYDFAIAWDSPRSRLLVETTDIYASTGSGWTDLTNVYGGPLGSATPANIHPDQHALAIVGSTIYAGNDGGVFTSAGSTWSPANAGLAALQFYSGAVNAGGMVGGVQDNGNPYSVDGGSHWSQGGGGDGFIAALDAAGRVYLETAGSAYGYLGVASSFSALPIPWSNFKDPSSGADDTYVSFATPLVVAPNGDVYQGRHNVWKSTDNGTSFGALTVTGMGATAAIYSMSIAANSADLYVMDKAGNVFHSNNGGAAFTGVGNAFPAWAGGTNVPVGIAVDPGTPSTVYAFGGGIGSGNHLRVNANTALSIWTDITPAGAPDVAYRSMYIDSSTTPSKLYVGTDNGVLFSPDGGITWKTAGTGLPNTSVDSLQAYGGRLYAFTHGRGVWSISLPLASNGDALAVTSPGTATAGTSFPVTVTARDKSTSAVDTGFTGVVTLTSTDAQATISPSSQAATAGVATFTVTLGTAGPQTLTATAAGADQGTAGVNVSAGPLHHLSLGPPNAGIPVHQAGNFTVLGLDRYGNQTASTDTIQFRTTDATSPANSGANDGAMTNGRRDVQVTFNTPGQNQQTLTASDATNPAVTSSSVPVTVQTVFYFAEGYTGTNENLNLLMPASGVAHVTYVTDTLGTIGPIDLNLTGGVVGIESVNSRMPANHSVSATVVFDGLGVAERTMNFANFGPGWHGSTDIVGTQSPATEWDFAEGTTLSFFSEFLTLQNPQSSPVTVTLKYLMSSEYSGPAPTKVLTLPASSRTTVPVYTGNTAGAPGAPAGCSVSGGVSYCGVGAGWVGVGVSITSSAPIVAERPMYCNNFGGIYDGHDAFGANSPATNWSFAEGATFGGINEYLTIANPNAGPANINVTYYYQDNPTPKTVPHLVGANQRLTLYVPDSAEAGFGHSGVSVTVASTNATTVVAERPMYTTILGVYGAHDVVGATSLGSVYYFSAASTLGGDYDFLTILNPGSTDATVNVRWYKADGTYFDRPITVSKNSRSTVAAYDQSTGGAGPGYFPLGIRVSSTAPVLVEKPTYSSNPGTYGATDTLGYQAG